MAKTRRPTKAQQRKAAEAALQIVLDALGPPAQRLQLTASKQDQRTASQLRNQVRRWHRAGDIVGYGVGLKHVGGLPTGQPALQVYVRRKRELDAIAPPSVIPEEMHWDGMPAPALLDVVEMAPFELAGLTSHQQPIFPGLSVGHCVTGETGSLGAILHAKGDPTSRYLLSAAHVIAASGRAHKGDDIIQPGSDDGGRCPTQTIAKFVEMVPLQPGPNFPNTADAALAIVDPAVTSTAAFSRLGTLANVAPQTVLFRVGCRTGRRPVLVENPSFSTNLPFPLPGGGTGIFGFRGLILYRDFSQPGDSGGPVATQSNALVGIHIARNNDGFGLAVPLWSMPSTWRLAI
jgi:hypothetical protein